MRRLLSGLLLLLPWTVAASTITAGPWLQAATPTSIVILWEGEGTGSVEYGAPGKYDLTVASKVTIVPAAKDGTGQDTSARIHEAHLTGLRPNARYAYRVKAGGAVSAESTFETASTAGTARVVHVSDTHTFRLGNTKAGLAAILAYKPDYVILSGDVGNTSINNDYRQHVRTGEALWKQTVHYSIKGNHDSRDWTTYSAWVHNDMPGAFSEDFYSFDRGPVHYVGINNNQREQDYPPGAIAWLTADLARSTAPWKVVFMKANPAITWRDYASERAEFLMPLFEKHGVDLVLTGGNSDGFHRQVNGVWYVHAGLGHNNGFWTLDITPTAIDLAYRQAHGAVTRSFSLGQRTRPAPPTTVRAAPRNLRLLGSRTEEGTHGTP